MNINGTRITFSGGNVLELKGTTAAKVMGCKDAGHKSFAGFDFNNQSVQVSLEGVDYVVDFVKYYIP